MILKVLDPLSLPVPFIVLYYVLSPQILKYYFSLLGICSRGQSFSVISSSQNTLEIFFFEKKIMVQQYVLHQCSILTLQLGPVLHCNGNGLSCQYYIQSYLVQKCKFLFLSCQGMMDYSILKENGLNNFHNESVEWISQKINYYCTRHKYLCVVQNSITFGKYFALKQKK